MSEAAPVQKHPVGLERVSPSTRNGLVEGLLGVREAVALRAADIPRSARDFTLRVCTVRRDRQALEGLQACLIYLCEQMVAALRSVGEEPDGGSRLSWMTPAAVEIVVLLRRSSGTEFRNIVGRRLKVDRTGEHYSSVFLAAVYLTRLTIANPAHPASRSAYWNQLAQLMAGDPELTLPTAMKASEGNRPTPVQLHHRR